MRIWTIIAEPGVAASLDMIPILRVVPERWALWKTRTRVLRNVQQDMYDAIIRHCEGRITRKGTYESLLEKVIPTLDDRGVDEALLRYVFFYHVSCVRMLTCCEGASSLLSLRELVVLPQISYARVYS